MKLKTIGSLLTITLLLSMLPLYLPLAAATPEDWGVITFLTIWTDPKEKGYWESVMATYEKEKANQGITVDVQMISVEMDVIFDEIVYRFNSHTDTDIISMHCMWLPQFAHWQTALVAPASDLVVADILGTTEGQPTFTAQAKSAVTYKGVIYGYPTEYNTWGLVYNKYLIQDAIDHRLTGDDKTFVQQQLAILENPNKPPLTWANLIRAAKLCTSWVGTTINKTGFCPMVGGYEEDRYQFMNLLWSNGGRFLDLSVPTALFNSVEGQEVEQQIYYDLGYGSKKAYDPKNIPGWDWDAWDLEQVVFMILPTWMTYIRDAMGTRFDSHLGMSPIPIGPHGTESVSVTYDWMFGVTQKAQDEGRAAAAWDFLKWLEQGRPAGYIPVGENPLPGSEPGKMPPQFGAVPKGNNCSIIGDWLILDSIIPSRTLDIKYGMTTIGYDEGNGRPGRLLKDDWWFKGMMDIAATYGSADKPFETIQDVQKQVGLAFENVIVTGKDPVSALNEAKLLVDDALPLISDINLDRAVGGLDAGILTYDIWSIPGDPRWNRGRSDINDDHIVDSTDAGQLVIDFGKTK